MRDNENPDILDSDCASVSRFIADHPKPSVALAVTQAPRLVECLVTHDLAPNAPPVTLPKAVDGLRAFGLNLLNADLTGLQLMNARLRGVNFTGVKANDAVFTNVEFIGCYLHGADFVFARFRNCRFVGCEVSKNDFRNAWLDGAKFEQCDLYANWARGSVIAPELFADDEMGYGERSPWDEGLCDGHEIKAA